MNALDNTNYKKKSSKSPRLKQNTRLGAILLPKVKHVFKKRGINDIRLIHDWHKIVGDEMALKTAVDKISFHRGKKKGILHIKTIGAFATELAYQSDYIIQRVNMYVGFQAISDIKIHHTLPIEYIENTYNKNKSVSVSPPPLCTIDSVEQIEDENIRNSLRRIAGFVYTSKQ